MLLQNLQVELAELIFSGETQTHVVTPTSNISIYQNNAQSNLIQTLLNTYPLITKLLGHDFFRIAAKEYIKHYPSRSGNLHDYGEYLSHFLAEFPPVKNLTYLAEVAEFEWLCHTLHFAADHPVFDIQLLEKIDSSAYSQLHFLLNPASCVKKFHYPLLRIIELCHQEIEEIADLNSGGIYLLVIRREFDMSLVTLSFADYIFLTALQNGNVLSTALDATLAIDANFKLDEKLPAWIKDKTIVDCYLYP